MLSGIVVARGIGREGRGVVAAVVLWVGVAGAIATVGIPQALTFYSGRKAEARGALWRLGMRLGSAQGLVLAVLAMFAVPWIVAGQGSQASTASKWFAISIPLALLVAVQLAVLQGASAFRTWAAMRMTQAGSYLAVLVAAWGVIGLTVERVLMAQIMALSTVGLCLWFVSRRRWANLSPDWSSGMPRALYLYGVPTVVASMCTFASLGLDQLVLSVTVSDGDLGLYAIAASLSWAAIPIASAVASVAVAHVARGRGAGASTRTARKSVGGVFLALVVIGGLLALAAEFVVVLLYGDGFREASQSLRVLALAAPFLGASQVAAAVLRGGGRPYLAATGELVGAVLTVVLLLALLPKLGILGAAYASFVAYASTFLLDVVFLVRAMHIPLRALVSPFGRQLADQGGQAGSSAGPNG